MNTVNIIDMIKEGLRIARSAKSLWLFGFFVGLGSTFNSGGKSHAPPGTAHAFSSGMALLAAAAVAVMLAGVFLYFVSEGALIEGVTRMQRGAPPSLRQGWRDGLSHWGVLCRLTLIYLAVLATSMALLVAPVLLAAKLSGSVLAVAVALPAALVAVTWLATLYMWQQIAARIAVLENRRALDAIGKARLFLHGRLLHGLKLMIAALLGRLVVMAAGVAAIVVAALLAFGLLAILGLTHATVPVIVAGAVAVVPMALLLVAFSGTTQSSIWTAGYLRQAAQ